MKATEILQLYTNGERDFRKANLRGQNFRGQDLSGADFSGADIGGTDFTKTTLKNANFSKVKAGLRRRWAVVWLSVAFILTAFLSFLTGAFSVGLIEYVVSSDPARVIGGYISIGLIFVFGAIAVKQGLGAALGFAGAVFATAVAFAVVNAGAFAVAVKGAGAITVAGAGEFAGAIAVAGAFAITIAGLVTVAGAITVADAGAVAMAGAFIGTVAFVFTSAVTVVVIVLLIGLNIYIIWRVLKGNPRDAWVQSVSVSVAAIGGTSFRGADLTNADFSQARLKSADLRHAILTRTNWHQATQLDRTLTADTILSNPTVRDLLVTRRGQGQSYAGCNLKGANLAGADLSDADLTEADLSQATLERTLLNRANLTKVQALGTNFYQTHLTGACLEAWNIDSTTQLDETICEYVYLLNNHQERRPSSGTFEPGEFTKLFAEVLDTIDLIFRNGLDWKAFVDAVRQVRQDHQGAGLSLKGIEDKGSNMMVVKLYADPKANKEQIHQSTIEKYSITLKAIEAKYRAELRAKDGQIKQYQQENSNLWEMTKLMASRPINVEAKAMAEQSENKIENKTDLSIDSMAGGINTGSGSASASDFTQSVTNIESRQTVADAAADIQALLKRLEQANPANSATEKMMLVATAVEQIESSPTLKQKAVKALVAGGTKALEKAIDHPVAAFVVGAIAQWQH